MIANTIIVTSQHPNDINTPQSKAIDATRSTLFNVIKNYGLACEQHGEARTGKEWKAVKAAILALEITVEDMTFEKEALNGEVDAATSF